MSSIARAHWYWVAILIAAVLVWMPAVADPPAGQPPAENAARADFVIPLDTRVTFGPVDCPVAVVGSGVYDLANSKVLRRLIGLSDEANALRALAADGKHFASASKSPNQANTAVTVWSTQTGKQVLEVPGENKVFVDLLVFVGDQQLLIGGRHSSQIVVWDIGAGKAVRQLTVPGRRVEAQKLAFTADGRFFACVADDKIVVTDAATNKPAAVMAHPGPRGAAPDNRDNVFVYAWTRALAYSPDGAELAAFSMHPSPRLLVWKSGGELVLDEPVPMPRHVTSRHVVEWLSDKSGWLVNGCLFDRASKRVVLVTRVPFAADVLPHLLDKERLIGVFGQDTERLHAIKIPWDKLRASLKQLAGKGPALVAPGEAVSLELALPGLPGDEPRKILTDALTARLARDGIPVAADRPMVLRVRFSDEAEDAIYEQQLLFDLRGKGTRPPKEAKGAAVLELVAKGEARPIWRGHLKATPTRSLKEELADVGARKNLSGRLTGQLNALDMPYFVSKEKNYIALPAIVE